MPADDDQLNLGCGRDIRPGHVNLDVAALPGVDVVHALGEEPLPFETGRFRSIVAKDVLEHVDLVPVMRELHRVLRPGGRLWMSSPHFTSAALYVDPTHRTGFSVETLGFFARETPFTTWPHYFDFSFARLVSARIVFHRYRGMPWNYAVERAVNRSAGAQRYYEGTALARLFPAGNVEMELER